MLPKGYSYNKEGYLWFILPVEKFSGLPETIDVKGKTFTRKSEFHVTIVNARAIAREIAGTDEHRVPEIEADLQKLLADYVKETPILFDHFEDDVRLAVTSERVSLAARCKMRNIEGYFDSIKARYGKEFPLQPAHVSIYTHTGAAVGIDSKVQMESYEKLNVPPIQAALNTLSF